MCSSMPILELASENRHPQVSMSSQWRRARVPSYNLEVKSIYRKLLASFG